MHKIWENIRPTVVLVAVCAIVSGLLAFTYNLAGVAELANASYTAEQLEEFRAAALPDADELELVPVESEDQALKFVYRAKNDAGLALVLEAHGYDSTKMVIMYGFNPDGVLQGLKIISHNETPGIGESVIKDTDYLGQYAGQQGSDIQVDTVSNATKTSGGIKKGAEHAYQLFEELKGEVLSK